MTWMPSGQHISGDEAGGELALVAAAEGLGAATVAGWSDAERQLVAQARALAEGGRLAEGAVGFDAAAARAGIRRGADPLGEAFCGLRGPAQRRPLGQTFTPPMIIESMVAWAAGSGSEPARVVDPGAGSARFLIAAGRRWPEAELVGVEIDPLAAIIGRASLAAAGLATRSRIILGDYRAVTLPHCAGPTLFLGNPPYVRHHQITPDGKDWLHRAAAGYGLPASGLAGLHVHFFLATARHARPGDLGALITAAEWVDVNYGRLVRDLLLGVLGGESVHLIEPAVPVFADATATSAITCFRPGQDVAAGQVVRAVRAVRLARVASPTELGSLAGGTPVPVQVLRDAARWGPLLRETACEPAVASQPAVAGQPGCGRPAGHGGPASRV